MTEKESINGFYFELGNNHYFVFPHQVYIAYCEDPFKIEADTNPSFLEDLVVQLIGSQEQVARELAEGRTRRLVVNGETIDGLLSALGERDLLQTLKYLADIEREVKRG
jgi:hypothetical protein